MAKKHAFSDVERTTATDVAGAPQRVVASGVPSTVEGARWEPALVEVRDRERWNAVVHSMANSFFTQTWEWGEISRHRGWEVHRLLLSSASGGSGARGAMQVLIKRLPLIGWGIGYAPRGPLHPSDADVASALPSALRAWGRAHRVATVVVDPAVGASSPLGRSVNAEPWRGAPAVGEERVHVVNLAPEADPWARLRSKHRQWIRRAERTGVDVAWTGPDASAPDAELAFQQFHALYGEVADRLGLISDPSLPRLVWSTFREAGLAHIVTATHDGVPLAALLVIVSGDEMVGFAGGQGRAGISTGAGKLVQWRAIQRAQELGLRRYNMWGTATGSLAHYKEGFGAREETYVGTRALAISRIPDRLVRVAWSAERAVRRARRTIHRASGRAGRGATDPADA